MADLQKSIANQPTGPAPPPPSYQNSTGEVSFFQFATFLLVLDIVDFFIVSVVW